jgi:hypothetical protein
MSSNQVIQDQSTTVEKPFLYTAIRNNRLLQLPWHELTESEQRQIKVNMFLLYGVQC